MVIAEGIRQWLYCDDGRRGGQQWRWSLSRAKREVCPTHARNHHCRPSDYACGNRLSRKGIQDYGDRPEWKQLRKPALDVACSHRRPRLVLLRCHRVHLICADLLSEYCVCRFPQSLPVYCRRRLLADIIRESWPKACLLGGNLSTRVYYNPASDRIRRHNGSVDSIICGGRVPSFHHVSGRYGRALAAETRKKCATKHADQWFRRACNRIDGCSSCRRQIYRRRLDYGFHDSRYSRLHVRSTAPLSKAFG